MKWIPGKQENLLPPIDNADYPKQYVVRIKGDDPHSGWIYIKHETAEQMRDINEDGYWEWLDESPTTADASVLLEALQDIDPRKSDGADQEWYKYYVSQVQGEGKESFVHSAACYLAAMLAQQELYEKIMAILAQYKAQSGEPGIQQEEGLDEAEFLKAWGTLREDIIPWLKSRYRITKKP